MLLSAGARARSWSRLRRSRWVMEKVRGVCAPVAREVGRLDGVTRPMLCWYRRILTVLCPPRNTPPLEELRAVVRRITSACARPICGFAGRFGHSPSGAFQFDGQPVGAIIHRCRRRRAGRTEAAGGGLCRAAT